jgi:hypothetical protein
LGSTNVPGIDRALRGDGLAGSLNDRIEESTLVEFEVVVSDVLLGVNFAVGNPLALPEAPTRFGMGASS